MPAVRSLIVVLLSIVVASTAVTPAASAARPSGQPPAHKSAQLLPPTTATSLAMSATKRRVNRWAPPSSALLSDPLIPGRGRIILRRVIRAINNTAKGEFIRVAMWNYDDRRVTNALLAADRRGVHVQVVVAGSVSNPNFFRTRRQLNKRPNDKSFAVKCRGGCRSRTKVMHSKFVLFSRVHRAKHISMFGSFNLTTPAATRQWNDMVTTRNFGLYRALRKTFKQYAADRNIARPFERINLGRHKLTLWPAFNRNPVLTELRKVACRGATGNAGNANGRTVIRIAIAGWFDDFGHDIARQLRRLWNRGCDIKIITTLAGRGINRTLRNPAGRGPVPIRKAALDSNRDGIPERYLHMKNIAISGVFAGDRSANVLITGSPNWSRNAQRSDETMFRIRNARKMVRQYWATTDRLYASRLAHHDSAPLATMFRQGIAEEEAIPNLRTGEHVPEWFELH